jgi:hypothetical protein
MNRWFRHDDWGARKNRPHPDWPDLIDFPADELPTRAIWFGGRQRHFLAPDYAEPCSEAPELKLFGPQEVILRDAAWD